MAKWVRAHVRVYQSPHLESLVPSIDSGMLSVMVADHNRGDDIFGALVMQVVGQRDPGGKMFLCIPVYFI